jgi:hypothetical protein
MLVNTKVILKRYQSTVQIGATYDTRVQKDYFSNER